LEEAVSGWLRAHGRGLTEAEQYAAAKMRLLRGFDEIEDMMQRGRSLAVNAAELEELGARLGLE
jgi:hypothetical protein